MGKPDVKVEVTAYKGHLVINTIKPEKDEDFVPNGNGNIGCVLMNAQKHLGMSKEAAALAKKIKTGNDAIGDVMAWLSNDKGNCFGWIGGTKRVANIEQIECSRDGMSSLKYVKIENEVPEDAIKFIDSMHE